MNDDARRLELARTAWLGAMPSETEVAAGARRVELGLGARPARGHVPRGWIVVVLAVLLGGTALAYVASRAARERPVHESLPAAASANVLPASPPAAENGERAEPPAPEPENPAPLPRARPVRRAARAASSADTTSWKDVDDALSVHDSARAEAALGRLTESPDAAVRAKAQLGRAQLAAARGDCPAAERIVAELAQAPDVPEQLLTRGRELVRRCR